MRGAHTVRRRRARRARARGGRTRRRRTEPHRRRRPPRLHQPRRAGAVLHHRLRLHRTRPAYLCRHRRPLPQQHHRIRARHPHSNHRTIRAQPSSSRATMAAPTTGWSTSANKALPSAFIDGTPIGVGHPQPRIGQQVCHLGVSSGRHCGTISGVQGVDQYLTTGMPASIDGDSGGPVWTTANGYAQIIGIWLGEKDTSRRPALRPIRLTGQRPRCPRRQLLRLSERDVAAQLRCRPLASHQVLHHRSRNRVAVHQDPHQRIIEHRTHATGRRTTAATSRPAPVRRQRTSDVRHHHHAGHRSDVVMAAPSLHVPLDMDTTRIAAARSAASPELLAAGLVAMSYLARMAPDAPDTRPPRFTRHTPTHHPTR